MRTWWSLMHKKLVAKPSTSSGLTEIASGTPSVSEQPSQALDVADALGAEDRETPDDVEDGVEVQHARQPAARGGSHGRGARAGRWLPRPSFAG